MATAIPGDSPDMVAELAHEIPADEAAKHHLNIATPDQPWPSAGAAWYALAVIIFATFLNFFDSSAFGLLIELIKAEYGLSDSAIGLLQGPVNVVFYMVVMLPLSRMSDVYPRKYVLAVGALLIAFLNAAGGFAMTFMALAFTRMLVGAGGGAHAPGAYSMLADYFPPAKRRWPFAILQLGYIGGHTIGLVIAGWMLAYALTLPQTSLGSFTFHSWKYVLMMLALPGILAFALLLLMKEPPRRGGVVAGKPMPVRQVLDEMWRRRAVYGPLFIALGLSTAYAMAMPAWMIPFYKRTFGWDEVMIARTVPMFGLAGQLLGLFAGPFLIKALARRYRDANIRTVVICMLIACPLGIAAPLMPSPWLTLACTTVVGMMGIMGAVPQNLIIQEITPNQMRGQVTGLYLMMFTAVGAVGPFMTGILTDGLTHNVAYSLALLAAILSPLAVFTMSRAVKPYGAALDMLEADAKG
ncbi:MFS transporter [Novosphingobium sp. FSY-8]|uniref:MFS transporter n=1 Tax=Novosphingobium ovatum TaxID=1908523 RepID=A0ABW9XDC2_9SPHN|nr:MFS transporter [Novosphingobium ovatum]NBC36519.1 MFS transporter [Novosphingobium ovatum]